MAQNTKTNEDIKQICAINRETVHKICSGQVVLNLAIAVKELVENAIDAGATNIDIRLKEYGSELVEVSDNGAGVEEQNFAALTLKHFTSKLREFTDLESVTTLGFRGEALSSLCALSNLSITTRHKSVEYGTKIEYDSNGHIKNKTKCARQIGTSVTLTNLFATLPVRHKEFIKNIKREFTKMCQLLYAYCLIAAGVRILCTNQTKKGARTTVVATQGSKTIKENIICVFGIKQLESLVEIKMVEPDEKYLEDYGIKLKSGKDLPFNLEGYISKCAHGSGRSASDRQFYYINSRPCEPTKVMKLVNEVYKYFNGSQYPVVFLNIKTSQSQIDVNVTPDKRQIFMEEEKLLLAALKTSLLELFKSFPSTLRMQNLDVSAGKSKEIDKAKLSETLKNWTKTNEKLLDTNRGVKRHSDLAKPKGVMGFINEKRIKVEDNFSQDLSAGSESEDEDKQIEKFVKASYNSSDSEPDLSVVSSVKPKRNKNVQNTVPILDKELRNSLQEFKSDYNCFKVENSVNTTNIQDTETYENKKQNFNTDNTEILNNKTIRKGCYNITFEDPVAKIDVEDMETYKNKTLNLNTGRTKILNSKTIKNDCYKITFENPIAKTIDVQDIQTYEQKMQNLNTKDTLVNNPPVENDSKRLITAENDANIGVTIKSEESPDIIDETIFPQPSTSSSNLERVSKHESQSSSSLSYSSSSSEYKTTQNSVIDFDIQDVQSLLNKIHLSQSQDLTPTQVKFKSKLTSKDAESELERHISKDMFEKMEIIGQFNKGFIVTRLDSDLFIIDQHATDEKYNFETLQKTTIIQNQKLVVPKLLDLTAANELVLIDNLDIFTKNGFSFEIDENAEPRHKIKLTAMPVSKNWEFGKEAIDELLFMLQEDSATETMRPSGIQKMFASRACRKSVMIGSSLSGSDMRRLVDHMGQIDQPWNCPHGRPTMRHLVNLDLIKVDDSSSEEEDEN